MPSPTGPQYPSASSQSGGTVAWTNLSNAYAEDGATAQCLNVGPGGGGGAPNQLNLTGFGFNIPSTAIIDGIMLEAKVSGPANDGFGGAGGVYLLYNGGNTLYANTPNSGQSWPASPLSWRTYGSSTSLWGRTWTPADINNANFGASLSASAGSGTTNIFVDVARITVSWHTAPADVLKRYIYKSYAKDGTYLGNLTNVVSEFTYSNEINTAGSQITIEVAESADTSLLPVSTIDDENGNPIQAEDNSQLTSEGAIPIVSIGTGSSALIKNGNEIVVWEYSYYYPNGRIAFRGQIQHWEAPFGGDGEQDKISILVYSDGYDLDNYILRGSPFGYTLDQSQTANNANAGISQSGGDKGTFYNRYGQSFIVGAGVTNIGAISLLLTGTANVTVTLSPDSTQNSFYATSSYSFSLSGGPYEVQFAFLNPIVVTPGQSLFVGVSVDAGQAATIYYQNTTVYTSGSMYNANYGGGSGGGSYGAMTGSLYFKTFSGTGSTTATYTNADPTRGMLIPAMNDYIARGGKLNATALNTGLSLTYTFNTNTMYEGIKAILDMSPNGFYYYVDLGGNMLYFYQASTTADIIITKGVHISKLTLIASIEAIKNSILFTGGVVTQGPPAVNLYKSYSSAKSVSLYGARLDRMSDNRVTLTATADAIGKSAIAKNKDEQYQTTISILDKTMDITLLVPGKVLGFRGFGTFADNLLAQIVRVDYTPEEVTLTLGIIPKRLHPEFEKITRGLVAQQTIANPNAPS